MRFPISWNKAILSKTVVTAEIANENILGWYLMLCKLPLYIQSTYTYHRLYVHSWTTVDLTSKPKIKVRICLSYTNSPTNRMMI